MPPLFIFCIARARAVPAEYNLKKSGVALCFWNSGFALRASAMFAVEFVRNDRLYTPFP